MEMKMKLKMITNVLKCIKGNNLRIPLKRNEMKVQHNVINEHSSEYFVQTFAHLYVVNV